MSRATVQIGAKNSLKQTMLQGFQAMTGKDVPNYTLLFLDPARNKMKGEFINIVVPHIELGRSSKCAIRYGEDFPTVSRVHASIMTSGNQVILKHLGTNPTLVNGKPVADTVLLQNGDEIQLSMEGPRLRYNTSATGTSSMKFTQRMALYTNQALAPYKRGIMALSALLVLTVAGFAYGHYTQRNTILGQGEVIREQEGMLEDLTRQQSVNEQRAEEIRGQLVSTRQFTARQRQELQQELQRLEMENARIAEDMRRVAQAAEAEKNKPSAADYLKANESDIYFIFANEMIITPPGGGNPIIVTENLWTGTGFLTDQGRFVTARHVIMPWRYAKEDDELELAYSAIESAGGRIEVKFMAYSPDGDRFSFTLNEMRMSDAKDEPLDYNGDIVRICQTSETDWAYMQLSRRGALKVDLQQSQRLKSGQEVYVSGYQYPRYTQDLEKGISPNFSRTDVAQSGLRQGVIQTTNRNFGSGSSGAPAIVEVDGEFRVIGIAVAGVGAEHGLIVPMSNLR